MAANVASFSEGKMYVSVDKDKCAEFGYQKGKLFITNKSTLLLISVDGISIVIDNSKGSSPISAGRYENRDG